MAIPFGWILEIVVLESNVDDFVEFVFLLSLCLKRRMWFFDLRGESVVLVRFEKGDLECVVSGH